jgi:hypothetical protein
MLDQPRRKDIFGIAFRLARYLSLMVFPLELRTRLELNDTQIILFLEFLLDLVLCDYSNPSLPLYFSLVVILHRIGLTRYCFME